MKIRALQNSILDALFGDIYSTLQHFTTKYLRIDSIKLKRMHYKSTCTLNSHDKGEKIARPHDVSICNNCSFAFHQAFSVVH